MSQITPIVQAAIQKNLQHHIEANLALHEAKAMVFEELAGAIEKFPTFHSAHEGFAVLKEEVDELWEEVRRKGVTKDRLRAEAVQVAAMAFRFLLDMRQWEMA